MTSLADAPKQPAHAHCQACGHVWVFAHVPCPLSVFVRQLKRAICPKCGETKRLFMYEPGSVPLMTSESGQ